MKEFRIWFEKSISGKGNFEALFSTYEEAKKAFDKAVEGGKYIAVRLQRLNPKFKWVDETLEEFERSGYKAQQEAYWAEREQEEREEEQYYSPAAPWNAPGMSIKDFI